MHRFFIMVLLSGLPWLIFAQDFCMRFYGHGTGDIDRVKIPIDAPSKPVDVSGDFTIEFQLKALLSENPLGGNATEGYNDDWTLGHIICDRDIFGNGDYGDFGISLVSGKIAFGVNNGSYSYTLIGSSIVADNQWHHIALVRRSIPSRIYVFTDGLMDGYTENAPPGDVSYRDGRTTPFPNDPYLVLGAEKHDYDNTTYPSYSGYLDELRISDTARYLASYAILPGIFTPDGRTKGLYHFDEGTGQALIDASASVGGPSDGTVNYGGSAPAGPVWVLRNPVHVGLWTGSAGTDWHDPLNWVDGLIPLQTTDVTIPAACLNYPVVTGANAVCGGITINAGALLTIHPGSTLTVHGPLTMSGQQ